jgi:hypothetical protein
MYCRAKELGLSLSDPDNTTTACVKLLKKAKKGKEEEKKKMIRYMTYLLTAIGLSPGGSTLLHKNNT